MEDALKKRLIGAAALVGLAVIFIPPLLEQDSVEPVETLPLPPTPAELTDNFTPKSLEQQPDQAQAPDSIAAPVQEAAQEAESTEQAPTETADAPADNPITPPNGSKQAEAVKTVEPDAPPSSDPAPAAPPKAADKANLQSWVIQAASFAQRQNAQKLVKRLRSAGLQVADLEVARVNHEARYRVRVGPMLDKSAARKLLPKVNALSGSKGRILLHRR